VRIQIKEEVVCEIKRKNQITRHLVYVNKKYPYIVVFLNFLKRIDSGTGYGIVLLLHQRGKESMKESRTSNTIIPTILLGW